MCIYSFLKGGCGMSMDFFTINFFPVIGILFMLLFMWKNTNLEKKVALRFYALAAFIGVELLIYNIELLLSGTGSDLLILRMLVSALGYSVRPFIIVSFIVIVLRNETRTEVKQFLLIPAILNALLSFSSVVTHLTFYYNDKGILVRGPLGWTTHIVMALYLVLLVGLTFIKIKKDNSFERIIILALSVVLVIATLAESLFSNYTVLRISITAGFIFYYMYFQSEVYQDELINKHIQQNEMTEKFTLQVIMALASTVDAKDSYTNGHSQRVAIYSREIARRMGESKQFQKEIYYMGLLHDIGKIGIPDRIINKSGKLTDEEFAAIKAHPVIGADVLIRITAMPELYVGALWHHERYDGRGYPDGLKGDDIPVYARIIAVADTYDAMTSQRSYRSAMSQEKVREELERSKRTQLDPYIANIMLEMMSEDVNYEMRETTARKQEAHVVASSIINPIIEEVKASVDQSVQPSSFEQSIAESVVAARYETSSMKRDNYVSPEMLAAAQAEAMLISKEYEQTKKKLTGEEINQKIEKAKTEGINIGPGQLERTFQDDDHEQISKPFGE